MRKIFGLIFLLCILYFVFYTLHSSADTLIKNDGQELKGIVVEDYKDRLIFSTADGEVSVMKSDIRELSYDSEEDNLIKLGEQAQERRDYTRAYAYYDKAFKLNPLSKAAKDGLVFLHSYLFRKEEVKKQDEVSRRQEFESYGTAVKTERSDEARARESAEKLKSVVGIVIGSRDGLPQVESVQLRSPAYEAGLRKGDLLVAIWGKLTGYMSTKEVTDVLLEKPSLEIKCTIERIVDVEINSNRMIATNSDGLIGAAFTMEFDGLTISAVKEGGYASAAGLKKDDLVVAIDGKSTRYMPLKKAVDIIRDSKEGSVKLTIRRGTVIWRVT